VDQYPITILQFLTFLYNNLPELMPVFMSPDVLSAMVAAVFPKEGPDSESSTPGDEVTFIFIYRGLASLYSLPTKPQRL